MNKITSIFGTLAVIVIAVVFLAEFRPGSRVQASVGDVCAVEINGECVSETQYWAAYRMLAPRGDDAERLRSMGLRRLTAEGLVERQLLLADAKRLGISVSEDELSAELAQGRAHLSVPVDKARQLAYALRIDERMFRLLNVRDRKTKKFDSKAYEKEVRAFARMSPTDFRAYQRDELIAARMRDLVRARVHVSENEAKGQFQSEKSTATIDYVNIKRSFYAEMVVDQSQKAIDAWAELNKEELDKAWETRKSQFTPECRDARHILVRINEGDSDEDKQKARAKLDEAKKRIGEGEDFADVAKALSEDGSASQGGSLGCVGKGSMVKPFEDALFAMKAGAVSDVVESQFGVHLIKVDAIHSGADAEKAGRRQLAKERYLQVESERLAAAGAKEILAAAQGGKSLDEAVKAHLAAVLPKKKEDKKKPGAKEAKKDEAAEGEKSAAITAENHPDRPQVETSLPFNITGYPLDGVQPGEDVARMAFQLAKPGDLASNVVPMATGYAVVQLKEKSPASEEEWKKNREFYVSAMRSAKQNDAIVAYVKRLKSNLGGEIKYNAAVVEEAKKGPDDEGGDAPPVEE